MSDVLGRLYLIGGNALRARQYEMDSISNNIANANTPAYKAQRAGFQAALAAQDETVERRGVQLSQLGPDASQGPIEDTGQTWDLAIDGPGYFAVRLPAGDTGYTRLGAFHLDAAGHLVNDQGFMLQPAITVPLDADGVTVDGLGTVTVTRNGIPQQLGRLQVARFGNPNGLHDQGDGIFMPTDASGVAQMGVAGENGAGQIIAQALEGSNVDTAQEMIRILHTQRAYGMTVRALQVSDQMAALTNSLTA